MAPRKRVEKKLPQGFQGSSGDGRDGEGTERYEDGRGERKAWTASGRRRGRGMRKGPENETRLQAPGRLVEGPTMQMPAGTVAGQITTSRIEAAS